MDLRTRARRSSLALPLLLAGAASARQIPPQAPPGARSRPVVAPLRSAGVYHVESGRRTPGRWELTEVGADRVFDNTCEALTFGPQVRGEKWQARHVLPSPTHPFAPCAPPYQEAAGCQTAYEIAGFTIAYCTSVPGTVGWLIEFADLYPDCSADMVPSRSFVLSGLPGGTPAGGQLCWVLDVDLSGVTPPLTLQADGDGAYDGGAGGAADTFGVSWTPAGTVPPGSTGMLLAGDSTVCTGVDGTIWDPAVDPMEAGTGMGSSGTFRITGLPPPPVTPGCYPWIGPERGMYLELYVVAPCDPYLPMESLCFPGQGGVPFCPCVNPPSRNGRGCDNSSFTGGGLLLGTGVASLSLDTVHLTASDLKPSALCLFLQGTAELPSGGGRFGQGVRCVGGVLKRLYGKVASAGAVGAGACAGEPSVSQRSAVLGDPIAPGSRRWYMVFYRDPIVLGGCPPSWTFNATQAVTALWGP